VTVSLCSDKLGSPVLNACWGVFHPATACAYKLSVHWRVQEDPVFAWILVDLWVCATCCAAVGLHRSRLFLIILAIIITCQVSQHIFRLCFSSIIASILDMAATV
jgi:hypothetical protein